jgi:hypothetical protein
MFYLLISLSTFSRLIISSSNSIIYAVPMCQWAVTLHGKLLPLRKASIMPATKDAQLREPLSLGREMKMFTRGSFSIRKSEKSNYGLLEKMRDGSKHLHGSSLLRSNLSASWPKRFFQTGPFKNMSMCSSFTSFL